MTCLKPPKTGINALTITDAYKSYGKNIPVLKGLKMTVPRGSIYGLLGPSGCGKSTLLNSIVGLVQLDHGKIETAVSSKNELGFMPQQISLYKQMTIEEILRYYALIYDVKVQKANLRLNILCNLLDLPPKSTLIEHLSGGQNRRLSLAVALIHDPDLLLLDEPTVGVDPILRTSIWDYLNRLCKIGKKTIVITTHYIEEMRAAHHVGLMRNGVLLCEDTPSDLIKSTKSQTLEESFLKLIQKQLEFETDKNIKEISNINPNFKSTLTQIGLVSSRISLNRMRAEIKKNLLFLFRNLPVLCYLILLPPLSITLFNFGNGIDPKGLKIGFVNYDTNGGSCSLIQRRNGCGQNFLSCAYLQRVKERSIELIEYKTVQKGIDSVTKDGLWGILVFRQNYSTSLYERIENGPKANIIDSSTVHVHLDKSNYIINEILERDLYTSYAEMMEDVCLDCGWSNKFLNIPIQFKEPIFGKNTQDYRSFIAPSLLLLLLFGMPFTYGVVVIIAEKNAGCTTRSLVAGVNILEIFIGHITILVTLQLIHTATAIITMYYVLGYDFTSPLLSTSLLLLQGLSGICLTTLLGIVCTTMSNAACICTGLTVCCILVGGMLWPYEGIDSSIRPISWLAPITFSTRALRSLTIREGDIFKQDVYLGFIACFFWCLAFLTTSVIVVKKLNTKIFLQL
ncbi:ABC transporter G family member 23-like [Cimex lectularius]|uniref:ABC transporter domain-containing protein n=1 Tax=Cimex lectularius TaxID=79782 RepID=A0A8I6STV2_CIMLE|nr:ABC transporter G family member 23-like [Cimex lectularius]